MTRDELAMIINDVLSRKPNDGWQVADALIARLYRLEDIEVAARAYYMGYVQDHAFERDCCVDDKQHKAAIALRDALGIAP